jgi:hypothetical protein
MFRKLTPIIVVVIAGSLLFIAAAPAVASGLSFGVESFSNAIAGPGGAAPTQAGSHPQSLTTTIVVNHKAAKESEGWEIGGEKAAEILPEEVTTGGEARDVEEQLPLWVVP